MCNAQNITEHVLNNNVKWCAFNGKNEKLRCGRMAQANNIIWIQIDLKRPDNPRLLTLSVSPCFIFAYLAYFSHFRTSDDWFFLVNTYFSQSIRPKHYYKDGQEGTKEEASCCMIHWMQQDGQIRACTLLILTFNLACWIVKSWPGSAEGCR